MKRKIYLIIVLLINVFTLSKANFQENGIVNYFIDNTICAKVGEISNTNTFQLYTHGKPGMLFINNEWLNAKQIGSFLLGKISKKIQNINIYGCEFAKGTKGLIAITYLQNTLNISVSASTNITGVGGDWILEVGSQKNVIALRDYYKNLQACPLPAYSGSTTPHLLWDNNALAANGVGVLQNNSLSPFVTSPSNPITMGSGLNYSRFGNAWRFNNISQSTLAGALAANQYLTTSFTTGTSSNVYTLQNWASYQYTSATWPPNAVVQISTDPSFASSNTTTLYNGSAPFASTGYMLYNLNSPYTLMGGQTYYVRYIPLVTTTGNYVMDAFGFNITCAACIAGTTAPAVTDNAIANTCPTATVNLNSLSITNTPPSGTRLVWSTHKPLTSIGDTLTAAEKSAYGVSGKVYAYYYSPTQLCYSPADSVTVTITTCITLGIRSVIFYGIKNSDTNTIIWKTDREENVAYFNLYKSTDAVNYSLIAKINSKAIIGDNNKEYSYVDNKINDAINFYKLSSVDVDGKTTQYNIVKINNLSNTKNYTIYPTLVKKEVNVELRKYKKVTLQILSVEGKLLKSSLVTNISNQPVVKTTLNMCNYANGIYLIRIVDEIGGTISIEKIIKQ